MSFDVRKVGDEWCAFHPSGREVARSPNKELLQAYIDSLNSVDAAIERITNQALSDLLDTGKTTVGNLTIDYTTPKEPTVAISKITYRTRARSTGASTASGRLEGKQWGAMCVSHGETVGPFDKGTEAEKMTSKPQEFCTVCRSISLGELPKVPKDVELDELL